MLLKAVALYNAGSLTVTNTIFADNSASSADSLVNSYGGGLYNVGILIVSDSTFSNNSSVSGSGFHSPTGNGGGLYNAGTATITDNIFTNNSASHGFGGGIDNEGGTLTVSNSTFISNSAAIGGYLGYGGSIYNDATATVTDSTFTSNSAASGDGGGIDNEGGTLTVSNSTFTVNSADNGGGGIYNGSNGAAMVIGSIFTGNSAFDVGGGGLYNAGTLTMSDSSFTGNNALEGIGGGILNDGTATVSDSTFTSNGAAVGGGISNTGTATVNGSTFTSNHASDFGGVIYNRGTATVSDSTFTSNGGVTDGGSVIANDGGATVTNCTVSGNTAYGGGIENGGSLMLNNTIVAGNLNTLSSDEDDIDGQVNPTSAFNLIGDGAGIVNLSDLEKPALSNLIGTTADPLNPLLGPLADYGGPTQTMALLPGSPAIDAGSDALAVDPTNGQPLAYDQRGPGFPRVLGNSVDIGAYEFAPLSQMISFGLLANQTYGVAPITLSATDTSGLPVSFSVITGRATLSGSVLTVTGAGTVEIEALQPGNATYSAAAPVDESFTVSPATLIVTPTAGQFMVYGGTVPALTYTASGFVNGDPASLATGAPRHDGYLDQHCRQLSVHAGVSDRGNELRAGPGSQPAHLRRLPSHADNHRQSGNEGLRQPRPSIDLCGQRLSAWRHGGLGLDRCTNPHRRRNGGRQPLRHQPGHAGGRRELHARLHRQQPDHHSGTAHHHANSGPVHCLRRHRAAVDLHLHRSGQRQHQRHVQRQPGDHRHVVERRRRLFDHRRDSGCDRQLHDRHVQPGHADGERGTVDHNGQQRQQDLWHAEDLQRHGIHGNRPGDGQRRHHHRRDRDQHRVAGLGDGGRPTTSFPTPRWATG